MKVTGGVELGPLVDRFMRAMHRYDSGRTLALLHDARLSTPQIAVLEFTREPQTISAIAGYLRLSLPATSQLVDKLVRQKLVRRTARQEDRRERNVLLSAKGRALVEHIARARAVRFETSLAVLPRSLTARFAAVLSDVADALETAKAGDR